MFQHNRRLQQFINFANQKVSNAKKPQDLLDIIEESRAFHGNFQFDNRDYLLYFGLDLSALILAFIAFQKSDESFWLFLIFSSLFIAIILLVRYFKRRHLVERLSDNLYQQDLLFDNNLQIITSPNYSQKALESRFADFHRGNYSREIKSVIQGHKRDTPAFSYHYYHFHYVDKQEKSATDSEGKNTTQTSYTHYDRYGLIIDLKSVYNLPMIPLFKITQSRALIGMNKSDYSPASIAFRKNFKLHTESPL